MIGMNAQDALGALEDVAIFHNIRRGAEANEDTRAFQQATIALRERNNTIARLRGQLNEVQHKRNASAANNNSAIDTLKAVVRDFAKATGQSEAELWNRYMVLRTQQFNNEVNKFMAEGALLRDPRTELTQAQKAWYVSGLDADHGF